MLRLPKSQEEKRIATETETLGLSLGLPCTDTGMKRAVLCLIRGLLVFLSTFGTIGGITSAFGLEFNTLAVGLALFVISVIICFTYFNKVTFYTGYVLIFMSFLVLYVVAYAHINSGFQGFLNEVYKAYSDFFNLPSTREATEYITDRSVTIPAAMLFTGAGFAILFNISISAYMDLFSTFLLSFLPLQLAFYIDIIPPMPYLVMLVTVYIAVEILSRSGRFRLPYRYKRGQQFTMVIGNGKRQLFRSQKKVIKYEYLASGRGMLQEAAFGVAVSAALMLLLATMFSGRFTTKYVSNKVKDRTDEYVKMLAQGGITSLFNRYTATGGISHGRLGGIASVTPDYETDLIIRLVPTSVGEEGSKGNGRLSSVYLKAYTGAYYSNNQFMASIPGKKTETELVALDDYIPVGANYMNTSSIAYMKMWLMNVDADNVYDYRPYFTLYSSSGRNSKATGIGDHTLQYANSQLLVYDRVEEDTDDLTKWVNEHKEDPGSIPSSYELIYTPFALTSVYEPNATITEEYEALVYENYLSVPEDMEEVLTIAAKEAGLDKISVDPSDIKLTGIDPGYREKLAEQQQRLLILKALDDHYKENYQYSMMPGATPIGRDTVEYFLSEQKRGYCVHFAASSALILRQMGIPTRYVEGYVVNPSDIMEAEGFKAKATDWILGGAAEAASLTGTDDLDKSDGTEGPAPGEIAIADIEIPDANAHAWTEVYIDGYGWRPCDFTPPSDDEDMQVGGIADFFARLFAATERNAGNGADKDSAAGDIATAGGGLRNIRNSKLLKFFGSADFILLPVIIVLGAVAFVILSIEALKELRWRYRLRSLIEAGNYNDALLMHYLKMLGILRRKGLIMIEHPTVSEVAKVVEEIPDLAETLHRAAYGPSQISADEYGSMRDMMRSVLSKRTKTCSLR